MKALKITGLPPGETLTWLVLYSSPFSRLNLAQIACFSSGIPSTSVYLVLPSIMALMAACLMLSGVSKSGSPAPRPMTFSPAAASSRAFAVTARVADGLIRFSASDTGAVMGGILWIYGAADTPNNSRFEGPPVVSREYVRELIRLRRFLLDLVAPDSGNARDHHAFACEERGALP